MHLAEAAVHSSIKWARWSTPGILAAQGERPVGLKAQGQPRHCRYSVSNTIKPKLVTEDNVPCHPFLS